jgi:hypothetical protein
MATAKQARVKSTAAPSPRSRKPSNHRPQTLQKLYARLEKTRPGSEESKRISRQIVDAIG